MCVETATMDRPLNRGPGSPDHAALVRRVNQLYHELTSHAFDANHRCRHRVERSFWQMVAREALAATAANESRLIVDLACGTGFVSGIWRPCLRAKDRLIAVDSGLSPLRAARTKWLNIDDKPTNSVLGSSFNRCGTGRSAQRLTMGVSPVRPAGVSGSGKPVVQKSFYPLAGDGASLPLADGSVDLLGINAALHHVPDPIAALREIDRVLRPGGYFALGFEPNHAHFGSRMNRLAQVTDRVIWYADLRQNRRRLRSWLGRGHTDAPIANEDAWIATLNSRLIDEGFLFGPLSEKVLLDLVDPHARGAGSWAGFDPAELLREAMPDYEVCRLSCCDYLGLGIRRLPTVRTIVDTLLHAVLPEHGSLFSWLIRKGTAEDCPAPDTGREGGRC